jgi:hypothetical protein
MAREGSSGHKFGKGLGRKIVHFCAFWVVLFQLDVQMPLFPNCIHFITRPIHYQHEMFQM